jgi:DNA-binding transcriptional regulator YhcF (GntR family)
MKAGPYLPGSKQIAAPTQKLSANKVHALKKRVAGTWSRKNAKATAVLMVLLQLRGSDGRLFPTVETIAERVGIHPRSVHRWLEAFEEFGFLKRIRRRGLCGQTSTAYLLCLPSFDKSREIAPRVHLYAKESVDKTQASPGTQESSARFSVSAQEAPPAPAKPAYQYLLEPFRRLQPRSLEDIRKQMEAKLRGNRRTCVATG